MSQASSRRGFLTSALRVGLLGSIFAASGCVDQAPLESAGVVLSPPPAWRPVEPSTYLVSGKSLAAWSGPEGSSLVVFTVLPTPPIARGQAKPADVAKTIAAELSNRATNLPGAKVLKAEVVDLAGRPAAAVEWTAPGTGDALAPSGVGTPIAPKGKTLVPTKRITRAFPRTTDTLFVMFHLPEAAEGKVLPEIDRVLKELAVNDPALTAGY